MSDEIAQLRQRISELEEQIREDRLVNGQLIQHYEEALRLIGWHEEVNAVDVCRERADDIAAMEAEIAALKGGPPVPGEGGPHIAEAIKAADPSPTGGEG